MLHEAWAVMSKVVMQAEIKESEDFLLLVERGDFFELSLNGESVCRESEHTMAMGAFLDLFRDIRSQAAC